MKFKIQKADFLNGLGKVVGITSRRTDFPITSNILMESSESRISIIATDLETGFQGFYPASVEAQGCVTIPGRKLFEIVRDFPGDDIVCQEMENGWVEIRSSKVEYHLVGMDPDNFPKLPAVEDVPFFALEAQALGEMIEKTSIATTGMGPEEKRAHMVGVLVEHRAEGNGCVLRMVSTDGNRLSEADYRWQERPAEVGLTPGQGVVVPKKAMGELGKILESEGQAWVGVKGSYFVVKRENETAIVRLVEGTYPNYEAVVPQDVDSFFDVEREVLLMMVRRMSILSSDKYRAVLFNVSNDTLLVSTTNPEVGESKEDIPILFNGVGFEVAFNPRYFIDTLSVMKSQAVKVRMRDAETPCILEGADDPGFLTVIMPMRM